MAAFDWHNLRVLILDGDESFAAWAAGILSGHGTSDVRGTASASEAFHMLHDFPADVVLVEAKLPEVSGVDFARWVRDARHSPNTELPLVLTASRPEAATLRLACEVGIESFMQKPIETEKFLRRLANTVRQPRRFVIGGTYFGPDRRRGWQPFNGPDRRVARVAQGEATHLSHQPEPPMAAVQMQQESPVAVNSGSHGLPVETAAQAPGAAMSVVAAGMKSPSEGSPQVGAEAIAPGGNQVAMSPARAKAREWQDQAAEEAASKPRRRADVPLVDAEAAKKERAREAERWKRLLGDEATAKAKPEPIDLAPILSEHGAWLRSNGRDGKRAVLAGLDLGGAELDGATLSNADLQDTILADASCREADFQGADMRRANLSSADVSSGNLGVARLRHADMRRAKLDGANLRGTDLAGANLQGASLNEADLGGANLLSTDIRETDLSGVRGLTQAQIAKVRADSSTRLPPGLRLPRKDA